MQVKELAQPKETQEGRRQAEKGAGRRGRRTGRQDLTLDHRRLHKEVTHVEDNATVRERAPGQHITLVRANSLSRSHLFRV